ncbi:hypothetical protein GCM10022631_11080 [Deinococcus rubellus]|uniref:hypothetical protein n=1 Tax=Deinococcus rubellus TaxID=1889240 RepID=UPI0031F0723C
MHESEIPRISGLLARLLRDRYPQPRPFPIHPVTLVLRRQEVHEMLPDLNRVPLLPLKNAVHPPLVFTITSCVYGESTPPIALPQIRRPT